MQVPHVQRNYGCAAPRDHVKKILIVATVSRQFHLFEQANIGALHALGFEVHGAANFGDDAVPLKDLSVVPHPIPIQRSPYSPRNLAAFFMLVSLMKRERFDAVHCHAPMGGVLGRLAAWLTATSPVMYTAHGYHFFRGAPLRNWLLYFPAELLLSSLTDLIITINVEDFERTKSRLHAKRVALIPGIGVTVRDFQSAHASRDSKRIELGVPGNSVVFLSIGELSRGKGHETAIRAFANLGDTNALLLICGRGKDEPYLRRLISELDLESKVKMLGFRKDIPGVCSASDVFVSASLREGLPVSVIEAMAAGLPIICTDIRGNRDLVTDRENGFLVAAGDAHGLRASMLQLAADRGLRESLGAMAARKAREFDVAIVESLMSRLYGDVLGMSGSSSLD